MRRPVRGQFATVLDSGEAECIIRRRRGVLSVEQKHPDETDNEFWRKIADRQAREEKIIQATIITLAVFGLVVGVFYFSL